jgi:hypothetical protein
MTFNEFVSSLTDETIAMIEYEEMTLREYFELQIEITERLENGIYY